jgi:hypothetical protein
VAGRFGGDRDIVTVQVTLVTCLRPPRRWAQALRGPSPALTPSLALDRFATEQYGTMLSIQNNIKCVYNLIVYHFLQNCTVETLIVNVKFSCFVLYTIVLYTKIPKISTQDVTECKKFVISHCLSQIANLYCSFQAAV